MLSGLPKLFDKAFVIGFLLPVVCTLIALAWMFPAWPILHSVRTLAAKDDDLAKLLYVTLLSYGSAILLTMTNTFQYRLLEGYLPPVRWMSAYRRRATAARAALTQEKASLLGRQQSEGKQFPLEDLRRLGAVEQALYAKFAPEPYVLMPTRFGTMIQAFEAYPMAVYGVDGPPLWLRLVAVIPKDYAAELEDARAQVNFLINMMLGAAVVAAGAVCEAMRLTPWTRLAHIVISTPWCWSHVLTLAVVAFAALVSCWVAYEFAIIRAAAWGDIVKAAFDCYLPALAKQLGYSQPSNEADRVAFWTDMNARFVYRRTPATAWPIADAPAPKLRQTWMQRWLGL